MGYRRISFDRLLASRRSLRQTGQPRHSGTTRPRTRRECRRSRERHGECRVRAREYPSARPAREREPARPSIVSLGNSRSEATFVQDRADTSTVRSVILWAEFIMILILLQGLTPP
jgi:hypothetical protein